MWLVIAAAWAVPEAAAAQPRAARLSFEEYLARVQVSSQANVVDAEVAVAEARMGTARMRPDPWLSLGLAQLDISGAGAPTGFSAGLTMPVELGGARRRRVELARADIELARADVRETTAALELEAALAFVDAQEAEAQQGLTREALEVATALAAVNARRFEARELGEADALRTELERDRARAEVYGSEGLVRAHALRLAAFVAPAGATVGPVLPQEALAPSPSSPNVEALVAQAIERRPLLLYWSAQVMRSEAATQLARRERIPDMEIGAGVTQFLATSEPQFEQGPNTVLALTVAMPLPFSNRRNGALAEARARAERDRLGYEAAKVRVVAEVRAAYAAFEGARARVAVFDDGQLERLARFVDRTEREYEVGESSLLVRLDAERTRAEIRRAHVAALAELSRARLRLERAVGNELSLR